MLVSLFIKVIQMVILDTRLELVHSSTFLLFDNSACRILANFESQTLRLVFHYSGGEGEFNVTPVVADEVTMLCHFPVQGDYGIATPLPLGPLNGRMIYAQVVKKQMGEAHLFHLSILRDAPQHDAANA